MNSGFEKNEEFAKNLDGQDQLAGFRSRFDLPKDTIYLDGNSLGLLSERAESSMLRVIEEWKSLGIKGWVEAKQPWFYFAEKLGGMASALVGAKPSEVIATGTTTNNIHSLVSTFYRPEGGRTKIIASAPGFPDRYIRAEKPDRAQRPGRGEGSRPDSFGGRTVHGRREGGGAHER